MHASRLDEPPLLRRIANVSLQEPFSRLRAFYARDAQRFRIYLDAECAMPESWKTAWQAPQQYGKYGNQHWPTKYAAAGFLPHMIANSPFVTADWRAADASVVVLFARHYAAGITIGQQQCLQRLRNRSAAFQATNGSRHFFIFTDSRGPCCLGGEYKDVDFLAHRIIGPHGERYPNTETASFISVWQARDRMRGPNWGPPLRCFDDRKDINIPTPNLHFPRTPFAQPLLPPPPADALRPTLLFYVGSGYPLRRALLDLYQNDTELLVRWRLPHDRYRAGLHRSRFCPICGGFSQWTPRLAEVLHAECVPIVLSEQWELPGANLLDWSKFSARLSPRRLPELKAFARELDYPLLLAGVRQAKAALEYHLERYSGADMLPLLIYEMARTLQQTPTISPPRSAVRLVSSDVDTDRNYVERSMTTTVYTIQKRDVRRRPRARNTRTVPAGIEQTWHCTSSDGGMCRCWSWTERYESALRRALSNVTGTTDWSGSPGLEAISWKPVIAWLKRHEPFNRRARTAPELDEATLRARALLLTRSHPAMGRAHLDFARARRSRP